MAWFLVIIMLTPLDEGNPPLVANGGVFKTMNECFVARDGVIEKLGRPIINYQAVCVAKELKGETT